MPNTLSQKGRYFSFFSFYGTIINGDIYESKRI